MERRQSGARLIFYRANWHAVISSIWGPVESKSHSARSSPRSRASINILTYTTWNSRLIYCRYLDALVFGPPRGPISSALKNAPVNAASQLPCYPSSAERSRADLRSRSPASVSALPPLFFLRLSLSSPARSMIATLASRPPPSVFFYSKIALRPWRDRLTAEEHIRAPVGSNR